MKAARRFLMIAALVIIAALAATPPPPAFAAARHRTAYGPYALPPRAPVRITIYPGRIDYSRYIDPISGMYCRNTGWAAECVPPPAYIRGLDCAPAWPFAACGAF
jgi:hypothetical protein